MINTEMNEEKIRAQKVELEQTHMRVHWHLKSLMRALVKTENEELIEKFLPSFQSLEKIISLKIKAPIDD